VIYSLFHKRDALLTVRKITRKTKVLFKHCFSDIADLAKFCEHLLSQFRIKKNNKQGKATIIMAIQ